MKNSSYLKLLGKMLRHVIYILQYAVQNYHNAFHSQVKYKENTKVKNQNITQKTMSI